MPHNMGRMAGAFIFAAFLAGPAAAESVRFAAASVNPTLLRQRLAQQQGAAAIPQPGDLIGGELYRPPGSGPFPAIVALHGCAGRSPPDAQRARMERYVGLGYVVLDVDSFGPRGIRQTCIPDGVHADRIGDAFGALDWLAGQPFVDAGRVAAVGFAEGGGVALFAVSEDGGAQGYARRFAAAVAYTPPCSPAYARATAPSLILVGDRDRRAPAFDCRGMMAARVESAIPQTLVVLAGARHGFDLRELEGKPGRQFGHRLEYSRLADDAAWAEVTAFLGRHLAR